MVFSKPAESLSTLAIEEFKQGAKQWVRDFIDIYNNDNVTLYIHAMMQHVGQFMTIHGSILPFTQQGLEKHNDSMTKNFFRSSCLRGEQALQQLVEKQNRIEHLNDIGAKRQKT